MSITVTNKDLALEALATRSPDTSISDIAEQLNLSRQTIYRYLADDNFRARLLQRATNDLAQFIPQIDRAMINRALQGNIGAAKLVFDRCGLTLDRLHLTGDVNVNTTVKHEWDAIPIELRQVVLMIAQGEVDSSKLDQSALKQLVGSVESARSVDSSSGGVFDEVEDDTIDVDIICSRVGDIYQGVELRKVAGFCSGDTDDNVEGDTSNLHTTKGKVRL